MRFKFLSTAGIGLLIGLAASSCGVLTDISHSDAGAPGSGDGDAGTIGAPPDAGPVDTPTDAGTPANVNVDNLASSLWEAFCQQKIQCGTTTATSVADCVAEAKGAPHAAQTGRRWGTPEDIVAEIQSGNITFNAKKATQCVQSIRQVACHDVVPSATLPFETVVGSFPSCESAFRGTLSRGDSCLSTYSCPEHYECTASTDGCTGTCTYITSSRNSNVKATASVCLRDVDCMNGESCFFNVGVFTAAVSTTTDAKSTPTLPAGASNSSGAYGVCMSEGRVSMGSTDCAVVGAPQTQPVFDPATNQACPVGMYCKVTGGKSGGSAFAASCAAIPGSGACADGNVCSGNTKCIDGACLAVVDLGGACTKNGQCRGYPSNGCIAGAGGSASCSPLPSPGQACLPTIEDDGNDKTSWHGCNYFQGYCNQDDTTPLCVDYPQVGDKCSATVPCSPKEALDDKSLPNDHVCSAMICRAAPSTQSQCKE